MIIVWLIKNRDAAPKKNNIEKGAHHASCQLEKPRPPSAARKALVASARAVLSGRAKGFVYPVDETRRRRKQLRSRPHKTNGLPDQGIRSELEALKAPRP